MSDDYFDRDYEETFSIEMEWWKWNKIHNLVTQGRWRKEEEDWPEEEYEEDGEVIEELSLKIHDQSPGNGMDDWPDSMKKAWDECVQDMLEDMNGERNP